MRLPIGEYDTEDVVRIVESVGVPSCTITQSVSEFKIVFPRALTQSEYDDIIAGLRKLKHAGADEYDTDKIRNLTPAQIDNWIENNVIDLASAKTALKKIGRALIFLYKRLEVETVG